MKIIINREDLAKALSEVVSFVDYKNPIMALRNIKITTKGDRVKIEACNSQSSIKKYITADEISEDGDFVVSPEIEKYVAKLKCPSVTLDTDNEILRIVHVKGTGEYPIISSSDYPVMKYPVEDTTDITIPSAMLAESISIGKNFTSKDPLRPQLSAIYAYIEDNSYGFSATNTHVLINDFSPLTESRQEDTSWYIEPIVFSALLVQCKKVDEVNIRIAPASVMYRFGDTIIQTLQTKAKYPDFKRVLPQQWSIESEMDRQDLTDSLNRVSMTSNQASRLIKLSFDRLNVTLSSSDLTTMKNSSETIAHRGCNGEITIGFNIDHLNACIGAMNPNVVCMRMTESTRAALFVREDKPNMKIVLMPMTLRE